VFVTRLDKVVFWIKNDVDYAAILPNTSIVACQGADTRHSISIVYYNETNKSSLLLKIQKYNTQTLQQNEMGNCIQK